MNTQPKKFLIYSQYFAPEIGASQSRLSALVRSLVSFGHNVEVVTALPHHLKGRIFLPFRGKFYVKELCGNVTIHRTWVYASANGLVNRRLLNYASFVVTSLISLLKAASADYIFVESPPLFLSLPAAVLSWMRRTPIILNVADLWPESVRMLGVMRNSLALRAAEHLEAWAYRRARYVNAVTEGIFKSLVGPKHLPSYKVLFLPNGVDTSEFSPRMPDEELCKRYNLTGKKVFIYAGTHGLAYRLDMLVDIAAELDQFNVAFMIIGDGYTKQSLVQHATSLKRRNVILIDSQPESEMPRYFSLAWGSIIPLVRNKLFEGTRPAKIFPSLASGVPVIYSGEGEGANLISEAQAGLVVPPENPQAVTMAIKTLAEDISLRERLSINARRYALQHFDWQKIVQAWLSDLEEREACSQLG